MAQSKRFKGRAKKAMGTMEFVFNDGGRKDAGFRGYTGDCVTRSIAIAAQMEYKKVYSKLAEGHANQRGSTGEKTARKGIDVNRVWFKRWMQSIGFEWTPTMFIGSGCRVHLREGELPDGRLVVAVSKHYTCVLDGVIHDLIDVSRGGDRCVYGYWKYMG